MLAADVAGYSRLTEAGEEGTLAALRAIRRELSDPTITEHRGRIVKTTGDGMLVEFSGLVDAVRCAIAVQRAMSERNADICPAPRIEFRIGIHQGDIIVEDDEEIVGEGVNLATRLEGLAEHGGICISGRVRADVVGKTDVGFEEIGEQQLKNISRPVRMFRAQLGDSAQADGHYPGFADVAIAAIAKSRELAIVTLNVRHFEPLGARPAFGWVLQSCRRWPANRRLQFCPSSI